MPNKDNSKPVEFNQASVNAEIERLKAENERLRKEQDDLRNKPFFAEEVATPANRDYPQWTFACPGPSLKDWNDSGRRGMLKDGPLVAVNSAIGLIQDADVWLVTRFDIDEQLREFGMTMMDLMHSDIAIWANGSAWRLKYGDTKLDPGGLRKFYPNRKQAVESSLLDFPTRGEWSRTVPLQGVALAISMGAKQIRLFGQDMKGTGYAGIPAGPNSWRNEEAPEMHARWMRDRRTLDNAILDCADGGVLLQLGEQVADIPKRTAPSVKRASKKRRDLAEEFDSLSDGQKRVSGNPSSKSRTATAEEKARILQAEQAIRAAAAAK